MEKNNNTTNNYEQEIDILALFKVVFRAKWRILTFVVLATLLAGMVTFKLTPQYIATATLLIEAEQAKAVSFEEIYGLNSNQKEYYLTQFEVIKSDSKAREVITKLNLSEHPDFISKPSLIGELKSYLKGVIPFLPTQDPDDLLSLEEQQEQRMLELLDKFKSRLSVNPINKTQLVNISFESSDRRLAALVANTIGEVYIESQIKAKLGITQQASSWLNTRLSQLRIQLDNSEAKLQQFREQQGLVDIEGIAGLVTQEIEQISSQLVAVRAEKNKLQSISRVISEYGDLDVELLGNMPEITSHKVIQDVKREVILVERKVSDLSEVYGEKHPKMISAKAELAAVKLNLNKQIKGLVSGIQKELNRVSRTVLALERDLNEIRNKYQDITSKETTYNQLKRDVETNRKIFDTFLSRSKETEVTSDFTAATARFTDRAYAPKLPAKPNKKLIIILAFIVSLVFAVGMCLIFDVLNDTVKSKFDVESKTSQRMLGIIPFVKLSRKEKLPIHAYLDDNFKKFSEAVRTFRTSLLITQTERDLKVITVTSSSPSEGKTTTSINLAMSLAQVGSVLLIDADLRKPSIGKRFDIPAFQPGLSNLIVGTKTITECIVKDELSKLSILSSGQVPSNPLELLSSDDFIQTLDELKTRFDHIIIDTPPTQAVSDSLVIAKYSDSVVYVVKADSTRVKAINAGVERLFESKAHIAGIVLNQVDMRKATEDQEYGYYDYHDYTDTQNA